MLKRVLRSPWTSVTLASMLLLSILMQLWGLSLFGSRFDPSRAGTWADFTGGVGSATAVIVAVTSLVSERRRIAREHERQAADERTRVYAWLEPRLDEDERRVWLLRFENQTRVPVYQWVVSLSRGGILRSTDFGAIRPGGSDLQIESLAGLQAGEEPRIVFEFVDTTGTMWRRGASGERIIVRSPGELTTESVSWP